MDLDRIVVALVLGSAALTAVTALRPDTALAVPAPVALPLTATPLPLDRDDPGHSRIGALRFLGAVQLRSSNPAFGGVSALRAGPGNRFLAVTDTGNWFAFDTVERGGRLVGVANTVLVPIRQPDGGIAATKQDGDSEALEWNPATGAATIVYEQDHRLAHFSGITGAAASLSRVPDSIEYLTEMATWPSNGGGEAVAVLPGGARVVLSETVRGRERSHVGLLTVSGVTRSFLFDGLEDHAPTDAVAIDDRRIVIINRRFTALEGQSTAVTLLDLAPALAGRDEVLRIKELARWAPPLTLDNMEGLALRRDGDKLLLYIVSDDNLSSLQRTVLMKFEVSVSAASPRP